MKQILCCAIIAVGFQFAAHANAATKPNPADYTIKVHISSATYAPNALFEIVTAVIHGMHYQLEGPTSSAKIFSHGDGLLNPGDFTALLKVDTHKTSYESQQVYEILMPDGTVRPFSVISQGE